MSPIAAMLEGLVLAPPQQSGRLSVHPLCRSTPPAPVDYALATEALADGALEVREASESGIVSRLEAQNHGGIALLLLDGEALTGAKQNRIVNLSVYLPAGETVALPVSCVEQGRWAYASRRFSAGRDMLFAGARSRKAARMARRRRGATSPEQAFDAGQAEIWDDVDIALSATATVSRSAALADGYAAREQDLDAFARPIRPVPGQVGAVFCLDGRVAGLELLETPALFGAVLEKLVRGYGLSALIAPGAGAGASPAAPRPFLARIAGAEAHALPAPGRGQHLSLSAQGLAGSALEVDGRVLHLAAFSTEHFPDPFHPPA